MSLNLFQPINTSYQAILNWVYPNSCLFCRQDLEYDQTFPLCHSCFSSIQNIPEPYCKTCHLFLKDGGAHCYSCKKQKPYFDFIRSIGVYEGPLKSLIHHYKYQFKDYLAEPLSQLLYLLWEKHPYLHDVQCIIPVPIHPIAKRARGYNQSDLLAEKFFKKLSKQTLFSTLSIHSTLMRRIKHTVSQTQLSREQRRMNVENIFQVESSEPIKNKNILLMDDVCTTGATLNACAKELKKAGAKKVYALTLARD